MSLIRSQLGEAETNILALSHHGWLSHYRNGKQMIPPDPQDLVLCEMWDVKKELTLNDLNGL